MIARLRGRVAGEEGGALVVDVGGVGYEVFTTVHSQRALARDDEVTVYVHTHVKEDTLQLFGFASPEERGAFRILLGVSNVGPRTALAILSGLTVAELAQAVAARDLARLSSIPGIGKKTAERLVFELKEKFRDLPASKGVAQAPSGVRADLLSALVNLGYKPAVAEKAIAAVEGKLTGGESSFEDVLREALRTLARA